MKWVGGLALGAVLSLMIVGFVGGLGGYAWVKKTEAQVRRGWNLVPVVVFARDVPAGTVLTFDDLSQRSVPEQLVTSSVVKPDSAHYVVNQRLMVPGRAGEPMPWTVFEILGGGDAKAPPREAGEACAARIPHESSERTLDDVRHRLSQRGAR